ncbi:MAG: bacteriohemerythrin [Candidatus Marinarcus sp.]|uniref:bacteriohemerythrin n=1 Tax=Candidatus Marinarcus sp. TaxID=3100987 RepID=UPI003AFFF660
MNALKETQTLYKAFEKEKHQLNNPIMDELHQEFLDIYNSVDSRSTKSLQDKLTVLLAHSKKHFFQEEQLMDTYGYLTSKEHKEEHNKVLAEMQYFLNLSQSVFGQKMLKAYYMEKIPSWFDLHLLSMDSDLAHFLKQKSA